VKDSASKVLAGKVLGGNYQLADSMWQIPGSKCRKTIYS